MLMKANEEWCRAPEPRALLPRVADPSATTHGAETSGAPVLGSKPDGDRRATTPAARHGRHALGPGMACRMGGAPAASVPLVDWKKEVLSKSAVIEAVCVAVPAICVPPSTM